MSLSSEMVCYQVWGVVCFEGQNLIPKPYLSAEISISSRSVNQPVNCPPACSTMLIIADGCKEYQAFSAQACNLVGELKIFRNLSRVNQGHDRAVCIPPRVPALRRHRRLCSMPPPHEASRGVPAASALHTPTFYSSFCGPLLLFTCVWCSCLLFL